MGHHVAELAVIRLGQQYRGVGGCSPQNYRLQEIMAIGKTGLVTE